ncbi:discoidin domain-containing protein [Dactylosporangium vinaceum]|uniref:Glycosyl hydrolase family 28-related protein n=1 Tax=Dactylosporangium vinaceum TaxID=53362 RepID=A0ABV5MEN5_9ACTN|nr:glycosyl hydrolase family 28-related protein [Dactylosporangium vinaceum]UAB92346.1 discoidin domain-containing protein [Dactylosporangium vinaceum]
MTRLLPRAVSAAALVAAVLCHPAPAGATAAPPGADTPFTTYEAENAFTNGARLGPGYAFTTLVAEASGRRAVSLRAGQWVEFVLSARADAINVRYSLPDGSPDATLRVTIGASPGALNVSSPGSLPSASIGASLDSSPGGSIGASLGSLPGGWNGVSAGALPGGSNDASAGALPGGSNGVSPGALPGGWNGASPGSLPGASTGSSAGVELPVTARYSHVYGNFPYTNNPADGGEHHYFDDTHALLGRTVPAGSRVRLTASTSISIDLADFELVGRSSMKPDGFVDVVDFGADPTGVVDSGPAVQSALDAGKAQGRGVWLPAGTYRVPRHLTASGVTVRGAGPWHTVLSGRGVGVYGDGSAAVHLADFAIAGDTVVRDDSTSDSGLGGVMGSGSTVDNVWIEHTKVGMWFDGPSDGLTVSHARIQNTMADGVNLHNGVAHTTIRDTYVRNTGDDGLAMWSDANADHDNAFVHDTVVAPLLANAFAVYGGRDNAVTDSVAADTVTQGGGIHVGNRFGAVPLAGTTTIARNVILRAGALVPNPPEEVAALWFYAADAPMAGAIDVHDVSIVDSPFAAVQFFGQRIDNVRLDRVAVIRAGTFALQRQSPGSARLSWLVAAGLGASGQYSCGSGFLLERGPGNLGWSSSRCGFPPAGALRLSADALDFGNLALHSTATRTVTVGNPGPDPIVIRGLHTPPGYTATTPCTRIPVGGTCTVTVGFNPEHAGIFADRIMLETSSPAGPYVVSVRGIGFDPDGNLALGQQIASSSQALSWLGPANLVDGDSGTYFESAGNAFPQTVTLDLGDERTVGRLVLRLPANWGTRTERIAVSNGTAPLVAAAGYTLNPDTGNAVTITFPPTTLRTLTLTFTANDGWPAAQLSELEVYAH